MTSTRSPAKQEDAVESGSLPAAKPGKHKKGRPTGLLPHVKVEVTEERRELVLDIAENLFPGKYSISDLKPMERERWVVLACNVLRGDPDVSQQVAALAEVLGPGVQAQIEDLLVRREADLALQEKNAAAGERERRRRERREEETHKANLKQRAREETECEERWKQELEGQDKHLQLEIEERTTELRLGQKREAKLKNSNRREVLAMGMAAITFACALVAFVVGVAKGEGWIIGGSGITGVAALLAIVRLLLSEQNRSPSQELPATENTPEQASA